MAPPDGVRRARSALERPGGRACPNFVDPQAFHPLDNGAGEVPALFPDLDWSPTNRPAVLLHASNFRPVKRVGDAVRALAEVRRRRPAVLVLVGDGPDALRDGGAGGLARTSAARSPSPGSGGRSVTSSRTPTCSCCPASRRASASPRSSRWPRAYRSWPSEVGGVAEVIIHGETGWLVPRPESGGDGAAALSLLADPARRAAMGRAARASAVARFQPEPIVTRVEGIYREVLARRAAGR